MWDSRAWFRCWKAKGRGLRQGGPCPGGRGSRRASHGWRAPESGQDVLPREKRHPADRARRLTEARAVHLIMHPADRRRTKKKPGVPRASSCDAAGYCTCGGSDCVADSSESCALASTVRRRFTYCTSSMSPDPAERATCQPYLRECYLAV